MSDTAITPALALATGINKFKKGLLIGGGAFAALLTLLLVVPHFVDLGLFKATYLPLVEDALGRRIDVGEVHLRLVPTPSIQISKLRVSDSQSYADNTFFAAHQVQLKLKFVPLLRGRFEVTELVLDKPIFNLLKQADGSFNYSDIAGKKTPAAPRREVRKKTDGGKKLEAMPLALPSRMSIRDGQMNLVTKGQTPVNIQGIELSLQEMSADSPFPFRASFDYPGLKAVVLEGQLNYQEEKALLELNNNRLKIYDLTLPLQGSVSNLGTTPKVNLTLNSDDVDAKP
ncbi:MAG: AsmA family protein, partial [Candidatus Binatia bacterium]